jgi:hypothetical protein
MGDGLYVEIRVASLVWTGAGRIDVALDGNGVTTGRSCGVVRDVDADGDDEIEAVDHAGVGSTMRISLGAPVTNPLVITAWRLIDQQQMASHFFCRVTHGNGGVMEIELPDDDPLPSGAYTFGSSGATVEVDSAIVYTSPVNPCAFAGGLDCP